MLRLCFNSSDLTGRAATGRLTVRIKRRSVVPDARRVALGFPVGTESQTIEYYDGVIRLAVAHQYASPVGVILASGKPDPKMMFCCGVVMWVSSEP